MQAVLLSLLHLIVTAARLCRPGGVRAVIAENLLLRQQLIVLRRPRQRAPNLTTADRIMSGLASLFLNPGRIRKIAVGVRPSTLLAFHRALVRRKYRRLFSSSHCPRTPGPKGPSEALIRAVVELKTRNPRFGCPRIARIISRTFGIDIDKNVVFARPDETLSTSTGRFGAVLAVVALLIACLFPIPGMRAPWCPCWPGALDARDGDPGQVRIEIDMTLRQP